MFVRYVVPHGLLELSCFTIAGVAGLRLARALIDPGVRSPAARRCAREARGAVLMVLGTAPWLVIAGLTEGFVTPRALPLPAALAVGLGLGGAVLDGSCSTRAGVTDAPAPSPAGRPAHSARAASRLAPAPPPRPTRRCACAAAAAVPRARSSADQSRIGWPSDPAPLARPATGR